MAIEIVIGILLGLAGIAKLTVFIHDIMGYRRDKRCGQCDRKEYLYQHMYDPIGKYRNRFAMRLHRRRQGESV